MLMVKNLIKCYGDLRVFHDVSFHVSSREIVGIIGPNGSGKTTLIQCIAGLLPSDAGEIRVDGSPLSPEGRKVALFLMPDGVLPWSEQCVGQLIAFFREMYGVSGEQARDVIRHFELNPVLDRALVRLSKGYRRRVLLALALLTPQPVLALDEPFDGLDLRQSLSVMAFLREVARGGRGLLVAIHQLADAARICDRLVLLGAGRVVGLGTLKEVRDQARLGAKASLEDVFLALT